MEQWMAEIAHGVSMVIELMAILIIAVSSVAAFVGAVRLAFGAPTTNQDKRAFYLRYARWLVAALTFQLAADLVHTAIAPTWDDIGRLAAIALIRTFLSYFLERDVSEIGELQRARAEAHAQADIANRSN
jgi:uncharacterized membrane protein